MFSSYEDLFRREYDDCRLVEEIISSNLTRYHVMLGKIEFSDSGIRDLAFKYALEEAAQLKIPPRLEQLQLWPPQS